MTKRTILISVCLACGAFGVMRQSDGGALRRTSQRISDGHTIAWARHITGQDVNDLTRWDDFNSVAVIPGEAGVRYEDEVWVVVTRTIDGNDYVNIEQFTPLDWGNDNDYAWFVDGGGTGTQYQPGQAEIPEIPGTPAVPPTYKYTIISELGTLWYIPVTDRTLLCLDNGGAAVNIGGGVVGLPYNGNPFIAGETVVITGTTNYDGEEVLQTGTSATELRILDTYVAETFDGTETVVKRITGLPSGTGLACQASDGTIYYAHDQVGSATDPNHYFITRIDTDGSQHPDSEWLERVWQIDNLSRGASGIAITPDDHYLYVWIYQQYITDSGWMYKFDLTDGSNVWAAAYVAWPSFSMMAIDAAGNAYARAGGYVRKFASADGSMTNLNTGADGAYGIYVDDGLGIIINTGNSTTFGVVTLDGTASDTLELNGVLGASCLVVHNGFIYAVTPATPTLYKISWSGTELAVVNSVALGEYGQGIYVDLWDNLVVISQQEFGGFQDVLWFYDDDLNFLGKADGLPITMLWAWNLYAGEYWHKGNAFLMGDLGTPEIPGTPGQPAVPEAWTDGPGTQLDGASVCVYADGAPRGTFTMDGNDILDFNEADYSVVIAGLNYYSIYESFPITSSTQYGPTQTQKANITDVRLDFYETLGANIGVSLTESSEIVFSEDDWATSIEPYTGPKIVNFPRGTSREPIIFLHVWDPVPLCLRGAYINANIDYP